jgi:tRNA/tmRNA/rRNA uracil-C5-methylase (TrmA/RlmC/RlmD family)
MALQTGRNYVKFDFNNIKLAHTWDDSIQALKSLLLDFIHSNSHHIYNKDYKESLLNFYALTCKLTTLNEIYILLILVEPSLVLQQEQKKNLQQLYDIMKKNTSFHNISFYYQLTASSKKPLDEEPIYHLAGPLDVCENVFDYKIYISPNSFTQSNYSKMIELYSLINEQTQNNKSDTLHYYGRGMSPICHVLHKNFKKLYGYSSCPISYEDGLKSLKTNNLLNIEFIYDSQRNNFFSNINQHQENSVIIISASRNGFRQLDKIPKFKRFIYIACNMDSFHSEIKNLPIKYEIIGEIDMFPGTKYKEVIMDISYI